MKMTQLTQDLFVGPQIEEEDLSFLASQGFTDVVCNRPDAEHPESSPSSKMADVAKDLGMQPVGIDQGSVEVEQESGFHQGLSQLRRPRPCVAHHVRPSSRPWP